MTDATPTGRSSPLEALDPLAVAEAELAPGLRHVEVFTLRGLLSLHWHGAPGAEDVVLAVGGAMGGVLGPGRGLYVELAHRFAAHGIGTVRVDYRRPDDLDACTEDLLAVAELAHRGGARRFVTIGHSFGGAIAVRAAVGLGEAAVGVVTLATQSAGCEPGEELDGAVPVLVLHGGRDRLLPPAASQMVAWLTGGELVVLPDADHFLVEAHDELVDRVGTWVLERLERSERS